MINLLLFRKSKWLLFLCFVLLLVSTSHVTWSQINISNTSTITQNFDGMNANTTAPSNWRVQQSASPTWAGGTSTLGAQASSGAPTTGTTYNWGAGVSDRAIGVMTSGGYASPNSVMAFFSNTNANNLTSVTISYDLERYRINTAAASVAFFYSTNGSTWVSVPAGDISSSSLPTGASSYSFSPSGIPSTTNAGVISKTGISITGLSIPNGGNFYLRWNLVTTGSNSQGIGIDNFSLAATFAPSCTSQTLTALTTPLTKTFGDAPYSVATTASSGLTVTYSSNNSSVATVDSSGNVTILGAGTATITASQAGDATYCAATSVTQVLTVNKATPIISGTGTATNITFGQTLASSTIGGFTSSTPGTFAFTSPSTAPNAGTASYGVTFTPTDLANYNTVTTTVSVTVNKANSSISVTGSNSYTYNGLPQGPNTVSQTGSNGAITYSYTGVSYGPTALLPSQAGTYQVVATVAEDANFNGASSAAYAFTISQVLLTVTADDQVAIENTTLPSFTVSYSGFVNNETEADLIEEPTASSPTADLATPGTYPIVVSGGSAANYTFSYVPGTLTITSASSPLCPFSTALADATPQTVCQDLAATVLTAVITNAGVVGTPTYQYQWYYNTTDSNTVAGATAISGATASTYIPETTASAVGTRYYFVVGYATDNDCGQTATTQTLASSTVAVTVLATPEATITPSGATSFCSGGSVTLTASPAASYLWSTGATTPSIVVTQSGSYTVVTTVNGCESEASEAVVVLVYDLPAAPTVTPSGSTTLCFGETVTLTASPAASYLWSTGATTSSIVVGTNGSYSVVVTDGNGCTSPASAAVSVTVNTALVPGTVSGITTTAYGTHVVISQVYGGGGNTGASYNRDFIELFNPTASSVTLTGWTVEYASATGVFGNSTTLTGSIAPGGYYLIGLASGANGSNLPTTNVLNNAVNMSGTAGKVRLLNASSTVIDLLGYGSTASAFEGQPSSSVSGNVNSYQRLNGGCTDTQNNLNDFVVNLAANPRNSSSAANSCSTTVSTETVCSGVEPASISVSAASGSTGSYTYSWYQFDGITTAPTGTAIPEGWNLVGTGSSFSPDALTADATFASYVTPLGCAGAWSTGQRQVTVNALPVATISPSGTLVLPAGTSQVLTASGGTSYLWSTSATTSTITASASGSYTVTVTDANGCESAVSEATVIAYAPAITTDAEATEVTLSSANLGGSIVAAGDSAVSQSGIVYAVTSLDSEPALGGEFVTTLFASAPFEGSFSLPTGAVLDLNTTYSYRAFATNEQGTTYGAVFTFTTLSNLPNLTLVGDAPAFEGVCTTGSQTSAVTSFVFDGAFLNPTDLSVSSTATELAFSLTENGVYTNPLVIANASSTVTGQTVWVRFTPSVTGVFEAVVSISGAGLSPAFEVEVIGFGINTPVMVATGVAEVTSTTATLSGTVTPGCSAVLTSGVAYSTASDLSSASVVALEGTATNLTPGTLYYYQAFAEDATGLVYGSVLTFTTSAIEAPEALAATSITSSSFVANWEAVSGASAYLLDVSTSADFGITTVDSDAPLLTNDGTVGTTGWVENAVNQQSGYISLLSTTSSLISPPVDLTDVTDPSLGFQIRTFGGVTGNSNQILVSISTTENPSWVELGTRTAGGTTLTAVSPFDLTAYIGSTIRLRFTVPSATGSRGVGIDTILLSADVTTFTPDFVPGYQSLNVGSVTSYPVVGLTDNTTYYYQVRATSANSTSENSNVISTTTLVSEPTFGGITQNEVLCEGSEVSFTVSGLLPNSISTIGYTLGGGSPAYFEGITASATGTATVSLILGASEQGVTLTVVSVERTDASSTVLEVTSNNTLVLGVALATVYYLDSDLDGYGDINEPLLSCEAPFGYVSNADDCDDSEFTTNPGAPEICFDGVDNNCNGTLYDGCAPVVVEFLPGTCGSVLPALGTTITCTVPNVGSNSLAYIFTVTNLSSGQTRVLPRAFRNFKLTMTDIFAYDTSYSIQVQAVVNGEVQPIYSSPCIVTTPSIPTTQLTSAQCGSTLSLLTSSISCNSVVSAVQYEFRVSTLANPTDYRYVTRSFNNFALPSVANLTLTYGTQYLVSVRVQVLLDGELIWSDYGTQCSIFTPAAPQTGIVGCGESSLVISSMTQTITAVAVPFATNYRYTLSRPGYTQTIIRPFRTFSLSMFSGLQPGTQYSVQVDAELYGVYYPGKDCSILTPGVARAEEPVVTVETKEPTAVASVFQVVAYPNPFTDHFVLDVKTSSTSPVFVAVYDMAGRLLETKELRADVLSATVIGERYPSGVYNAIVTQGEETRTVRVIKR